MKEAEYLVTGGAGFIGANLTARLVDGGKSVRVLDNLATGRKENLDPLLDRIDFVEGDIRDAETVGRAVEGTHCIFHLAALPSVPRSIEEPVETCEVNSVGTLRVLEAARKSGSERIVFSSSSSVYGDTDELPKREDMIPRPISPYAIQKFTGECYMKQYFQLYGLKTFSLRYFNVFGPMQNPASRYAAVIPLFINALFEGKAPVVHGDGLQTRDFTFVDNVVEANLACAGAPAKAAGKVYNVACGGRTGILELASTLARIMKKEITPVHDDPRPGDVRDSEGDIAKAGKLLDWKPKVDLEEGLKRTVQWHKG
ncbi:MAG: SDR family oxidoreductase [Kiritimatiellia bacterium]